MKKKIVVCDDDKEILNVFSMVLEDQDTIVVTVANSLVLMEVLDSIHADILFLDIHMAARNGDLILRDLRSSSKHNKLPVIMISGHIDGRSISIACGADGFLAKPFDLTDLESYIRRFVYDNES
ncbi:response regulator [Sphingobacterium sp. ML3W]|uniref:response regulator n=1 Tax=Sphingobacterium sp. ML3W TaxID=1538644 RepID=UPI00249BA0BA|nr:response regulator [Sphingobacterium sp. ML3W]WFA81056.1 response regulator [Sphingobacterium sp. ML3W]